MASSQASPSSKRYTVAELAKKLPQITDLKEQEICFSIFKQTCKLEAERLLQQTDVDMQHQIHLYQLKLQIAAAEEREKSDSKATTVTAAPIKTREALKNEYHEYKENLLKKACAKVLLIPDTAGQSPLDYLMQQNHGSSKLHTDIKNWIHEILKSVPENLKKEPQTVAEFDVEKCFQEANRKYYNPTEADQAATTITSCEKDALINWFMLAADHTHLNTLQALEKHYRAKRKNKNNIANLLKGVHAIADSSTLVSLKNKHKTNNIFLIYWKEKLLPATTGATQHSAEDFFETLLKYPKLVNENNNNALWYLLDDLGIDYERYLKFESLPPAAYEWYRSHLATECFSWQQNQSNFLAEISEKKAVTVMASRSNCPVDVIKLVFSMQPYLNEPRHGMVNGLAEAASNHNVALVNWFLDEKQHPKNKIRYTASWRDGISLFDKTSTRPLYCAMISSQDNTTILRKICRQYLEDKEFTAACTDANSTLVLLKKYQTTKNNTKTRYLQCFHAMASLNWANGTAPEVVNTITELKSHNQTADLKHLYDLFRPYPKTLEVIQKHPIPDDAKTHVMTTQATSFKFTATPAIRTLSAGAAHVDNSEQPEISTKQISKMLDVAIEPPLTSIVHKLTKTLRLADSDLEQRAIRDNITKSFGIHDPTQITNYLADIFFETFIHHCQLEAAEFIRNSAQDNISEQNAYQYIFATPGPDDISPLQHMETQRRLATTSSPTDSSLTERVFNKMHELMGKPTPQLVITDHSTPIDSKFETALALGGAAAFKLITEETHLGMLHKYQIGYETLEGIDGNKYKLFSTLTEYTKNNSTLIQLKEKHQTNNIVIIHFRENHPQCVELVNAGKWAEAKLYIENNIDVLYDLFCDIGFPEKTQAGIGKYKTPTLYVLLELLPPEDCEWYRDAKKLNHSFFNILSKCFHDMRTDPEHSELYNPVAAAASFPGCPVAIIKIIFALYPHLNRTYCGHTALAYAAGHGNLALTTWLTDEKNHTDNRIRYRIEWHNDPFGDSVRKTPLACALLDDPANTDTKTLQHLCAFSLQDKDTGKYSGCYTDAFNVLTLCEDAKPTDKSRYLECFTAIVLYTYPPAHIKDQKDVAITAMSAANSNINKDDKQPAAKTKTPPIHLDPKTTRATLKQNAIKKIHALIEAKQTEDLRHLQELFSTHPTNDCFSNIAYDSTPNKPISVANSPFRFQATPIIGNTSGIGPTGEPPTTLTQTRIK